MILKQLPLCFIPDLISTGLSWTPHRSECANFLVFTATNCYLPCDSCFCFACLLASSKSRFFSLDSIGTPLEAGLVTCSGCSSFESMWYELPATHFCLDSKLAHLYESRSRRNSALSRFKNALCDCYFMVESSVVEFAKVLDDYGHLATFFRNNGRSGNSKLTGDSWILMGGRCWGIGQLTRVVNWTDRFIFFPLFAHRLRSLPWFR